MAAQVRKTRVEIEARQKTFEKMAAHTPLISVRTTTGALFLVATSDAHVGRSLYGKQSRKEMGVLARAVRGVQHFFGEAAVDGGTFLDVGANIGTTIVTALRQYPFADGFAFEPERDNHELLALNLALNDLDDRSVALRMAVSSATGLADLVIQEGSSGKHWINSAGLEVRETTSTVAVPTVSLDELVSMKTLDPDRVKLTWIDAEGHEGYILRGATSLCARGCPTVLEWNPEALIESGSMSLLEEIFTSDYTHFIDLLKSREPGSPAFELREIGALEAFGQRFRTEDRARQFTDILVLRLDEQQAERTDLSVMAGKRR